MLIYLLRLRKYCQKHRCQHATLIHAASHVKELWSCSFKGDRKSLFSSSSQPMHCRWARTYLNDGQQTCTTKSNHVKGFGIVDT